MFIYAQDSPDGEISRMEEASQIDWYEGLKLYAYASPAEALGDNFITWGKRRREYRRSGRQR